MTKVLTLIRCGLFVTLILVAVISSASAANTRVQGPAETLYLQLGQVGLDPTRVYKVRGAAIERPAVHVTLEDGEIGFTRDVMGRITGAFFEGDGEILLTPPDEVERKSMSLFTGMAILEERFSTAYFRFNDDTASELRPDLRATDDGQDFVTRWGDTAKNLAQLDAMRILITLSRSLPSGTAFEAAEHPVVSDDRVLHARFQGTKLGIFDLYFDSTAGDEVQIGQAKTVEHGGLYYDVWSSFSPEKSKTRRLKDGLKREQVDRSPSDWVRIRQYRILTEVQPPKRIQAQADLQGEIALPGARILVFELSRFLQIESAVLDGRPVEFIQNPAIEGTQLSRRGNDLVAVVLPDSSRAGQKFDLHLVYAGEVLAEAGSGLLYVGARGTWYPNRGMSMANFDLTFRYPQGWTLVATGKPEPPLSSPTASDNEQRMRWVSERPIPLAGFNLGKYKLATSKAGNVTVETYATSGVERDFPTPSMQVVEQAPMIDPGSQRNRVQVVAPTVPSPARNAQTVGERAARAIEYFSSRFGPYPYSHLFLTQMPGRESQGWPGLVFLSSFAFLNDADRAQLRLEPFRSALQQQIPAHETAHQWWGDLVTWASYRDQWLSEGLANYCALMMLQETNPTAFHEIMEKYREDLLEKNQDGALPKDAGPVTLGARLVSSHFPEGYEAISYGRGTWLFHMLRSMLQDAALQEARASGKRTSASEEPFVRALHRVRDRYEGRSISTQQLLDVFAEDIPSSLRYEGKQSFDWFLDGWVSGTDVPKLELRSVKISPKANGMTVSGTILQKGASPNLVTSVPVYAVSSGKQATLLGRVFADGEESTFHLSAPAGVKKIVLDPNETILANPK